MNHMGIDVHMYTCNRYTMQYEKVYIMFKSFEKPLSSGIICIACIRMEICSKFLRILITIVLFKYQNYFIHQTL